MWIHRKMRSRLKKEWPGGGGGGGQCYSSTDMLLCCQNEVMASPTSAKYTTNANWILVLCIFILLSPAMVSAQCPTSQCHCEVQEGKAIINCRYKGLTQVPTWNPTSSVFYELTLANNQISTLGPQAFSGLNIKRLDLSANRITSVDPTAFQGIEGTMEELLLHVDQMQLFPKEALADLINLKLLVVEGFNISTLPQNALATQSKIHTLKIDNCHLQSVQDTDFTAFRDELLWLSLSTNKLVNIPQSVVSQLQNLDFLDVSHNRLRVLADNLFSGNSKITMLDFSNNQLDTIRPNAYVGLENSLLTLILQNNKLTDNQLPPLKLLRSITSLNLANNQVVTIPEDTFTGIPTLENLNIRANRLEALLKQPFVPLTGSLKKLELAENKVINIQPGFFGAFTALEELDLHGQILSGALNANTFNGLERSLVRLNMKSSQLTSADLASISNLAKLQSLNLAMNNIMQIPPFTLQRLTQLENLDVSYNSITELSQRSMHGPQATLNTINLITNDLETIPECTFYMFSKMNSVNSIKLGKNPLRCDCGLIWLRKWVDDTIPKTSQAIVLYDWKCTSPAGLANSKFHNVSRLQLCAANPTPTPEVCEDLSATTTPVIASTTPGGPSPGGPSVKVTNISHDSAWVRWTTWSSPVMGFIIESYNKRNNNNESNKRLAPEAREHQLTGLTANTPYTVCVTFLYNNTEDETRLCKDFDTVSEPAPVTDGSNVGAIVGAVIGVLAFLALLILLGFLVVRSRTGGDQWFSKPAWLGGSNAGANENNENTNKWRTPTGVPQIGYNSKRFSRPKSRDPAATASTTSSQLAEQNRANNELEMKLAGFSAEERDRIINMLTNTGGSTVSMISSGSNQRYVPELPPRPQSLEGYLNPQSIRDEEEEDPYKHIYDEIPAASNYYEIPVGGSGGTPSAHFYNNNEHRGSSVSVHSGKYEGEPHKEKQEGACYI